MGPLGGARQGVRRQEPARHPRRHRARQAAVVRRRAGADQGAGQARRSAGARRTGKLGALTLRGVEGVAIQYAKCCRPVPGDAIVGQFRRGQGLLVHTRDCVTLKKQRLDASELVDVEWATDVQGVFEIGHAPARRRSPRPARRPRARDRRCRRQHRHRCRWSAPTAATCSRCSSACRCATAGTSRRCCARCGASPTSSARPDADVDARRRPPPLTRANPSPPPAGLTSPTALVNLRKNASGRARVTAPAHDRAHVGHHADFRRYRRHSLRTASRSPGAGRIARLDLLDVELAAAGREALDDRHAVARSVISRNSSGCARRRASSTSVPMIAWFLRTSNATSVPLRVGGEITLSADWNT